MPGDGLVLLASRGRVDPESISLGKIPPGSAGTEARSARAAPTIAVSGVPSACASASAAAVVGLPAGR
jgi:hypothetical protein